MNKKNILFVLFLAFFGVARADIVEIGDGGTTNNTYLPGYNYYKYSLTQQIYLSEEIGTAGTIISIAFQNTGAEKTRTYNVYLLHTDKETFESGTDWVAMSDDDLVFSGELTFTVGEWTTIDFDTPFNYDGTSNLIVGVADVSGAYTSSPHMACLVFDATGQAIRAYRDASAYDIAAPGVTGAVLDVKNQIHLGIIPSGGSFCEKPSSLEAYYVTESQASLTWSGGSGTYNLQYKKTSDQNWTTAVANTHQFSRTISGLESNTPYQARVQSVCGSDVSGWKTASFTTLETCPDGMICLGSGQTTNSYLPTFVYYKNSLTQQIYTANEIGAATAILSIDFYCTQDNTYARNFDIYMVSTDKSEFESVTDWITVTEGDLVYSGTVTLTQGWNTFELDNPFVFDGVRNVALIIDASASNYQNGPAFFVYDAPGQALRVYSDGTNYDPFAPSTYTGMIMDVKNRLRLTVGNPPACIRPLGLVCEEVSKRTADLSWISDASAWQICLNGNESNLINVTSNPFTLTGLTPETTYTVKVRANCGATDGVSAWSKEITFTTNEYCSNPTNLTVSELKPTSAQVGWTSDNNSFQLRYRKKGSNEYGFEDGTLGDWTTIDADGDGYVWYPLLNSNTTNDLPGHYGSDGHVTSASYQGSALTPDNYLVSPQIAFGGSITFYACAQDASWAGEHFGVAVSTTGNTDAADFTTIIEWDMTSKAQGAWYQYTVDLSGYSGQGYVAIRHFNCTDMFRLNVDDITILQPSVTEPSWTTVTNASNPYILSGLSPETTYIVQVRSNCGSDGYSDWVETTFMTPGLCDPIMQFQVSDVTSVSAYLSWTGTQESYKVRFRIPGTIEPVPGCLSWNFDDSSMGDWTTIDADGDGYKWVLGSACGGIYLAEGASLAGLGHGSSADFVTSGSYSNVTGGALTPDNYLVSPQITLGSSITFWVCAQDANYATEHFGVAVSTTNNTDASAFTTIQEWTLTAKGVGAKMNPGMTRSGNRGQGTWYQFSVDLTGYSGQGYVAIRHFDCTDLFMLNVDDISYGEMITTPASNWQTYSNVTSPFILEGLNPNTAYEVQVQGNCPNNAVTEWTNAVQFTTLAIPEEFEITVMANPNYGGTVSGGDTYQENTTCTVIAAPNEGWAFVNWTENDTVVSTEETYSFKVTGARTLVANFEMEATENYYTPQGEGFEDNMTLTGVIQIDGVEQTSTALEVGAFCNGQCRGTVRPVFFPATQRYLALITIFGENGDALTFKLYDHEQNAELDLVSPQGIVFGSSSIGSLMDPCVLNFTHPVVEYSIGVTANPAAGGTVSGAGTYQEGQSCTLTATPNAGYTFVRWTKNGSQVSTNPSYTFTVTADASYVAEFSLNSYGITVTASPAEGGTVTGVGNYSYGSSVTLTATPNAGYTFVRWTRNGTQVSTNPNYTFTVSGAASYVAVFSLNSYAITASANPSDGGMVSGAGTYNHGASCSLNATANEGYAFVNWTENGTAVSTANPYSFTVTGARTLVAQFEVVQGDEDHWIPQGEGFEDNMTLTGVIQIDGVEQTTTALELGAFCNGQCRGTVRPIFFPATQRYLALITIFGVNGDALTFKLYDHDQETELDLVSPQGIVFGSSSIGSLMDPYVLNFTTNGSSEIATFTRTLDPGWNWFSCNLEFDGDMLEELKAAIASVCSTAMIKTQNNGFINYASGRWSGSITQLGNEMMLLICVDQEVNFTVEGMTADPLQHPVTLTPGWNWIGYVEQGTMSLSAAFANFSPENGDMVKCMNSFSIYNATSGTWSGNLKNLEPGNGYVYLSNRSGNVEFVYPNANGKGVGKIFGKK